MMQNIKVLAQLIQAATSQDSQIYQTATQIALIAGQKGDQEQTIQTIAQLAVQICNQDRSKTERTPESDERAYAFHLCHAMIGLCKYAVKNMGIIQYPPAWPGAPVWNIGDFIKDRGAVEGIVRDGATWCYYLRECGWFKEDDLCLQEEPEPIMACKLDNEPTTPYKAGELIDGFDPFLDQDDL